MVDAEYHKNRRSKRKNKLLALLGGKCAICGSKENLQFDHKDPKHKKFHISRRVTSPEESIIDELKKCQLLCKSCHHQKTLENQEYGLESEHGTIWKYKRGCRCDLCKKAISDYYYHKLAFLSNLFVKLSESC